MEKVTVLEDAVGLQQHLERLETGQIHDCSVSMQRSAR